MAHAMTEQLHHRQLHPRRREPAQSKLRDRTLAHDLDSLRRGHLRPKLQRLLPTPLGQSLAGLANVEHLRLPDHRHHHPGDERPQAIRQLRLQRLRQFFGLWTGVYSYRRIAADGVWNVLLRRSGAYDRGDQAREEAGPASDHLVRVFRRYNWLRVPRRGLLLHWRYRGDSDVLDVRADFPDLPRQHSVQTRIYLSWGPPDRDRHWSE